MTWVIDRRNPSADPVPHESASQPSKYARYLQQGRYCGGADCRRKTVLMDNKRRNVKYHRVIAIGQRDENQEADQYAVAKDRVTECLDQADFLRMSEFYLRDNFLKARRLFEAQAQDEDQRRGHKREEIDSAPPPYRRHEGEHKHRENEAKRVKRVHDADTRATGFAIPDFTNVRRSN